MAALQIYGALFKAFSNLGKASKQKLAAEETALDLEQQGDIAIEDARRQAASIQRQGERFKGTQIASMAARGVVAGTGSNLDLLTEAVVSTRLRASDALRRGAVDQLRARKQASEVRRTGRSQSRASLISAGGNLLETSLTLNANKERLNNAKNS